MGWFNHQPVKHSGSFWMMEKPLLEKMVAQKPSGRKDGGWTSIANKVTKLFPAIFPPFSFLLERKWWCELLFLCDWDALHNAQHVLKDLWRQYLRNTIPLPTSVLSSADILNRRLRRTHHPMFWILGTISPKSLMDIYHGTFAHCNDWCFREMLRITWEGNETVYIMGQSTQLK